MAIFRGGKRVGPFDIRVGIPRDRSLENVDRDPRLKQYANTENHNGSLSCFYGSSRMVMQDQQDLL